MSTCMQDQMTPTIPTYMHFALSIKRDMQHLTHYHTNGTAWIHSACAWFSCGKNRQHLGLALLKYKWYLCMAYIDDLFDHNTYVKLTHNWANQYIMEMHTLFKCWLHKYTKVIPKTKAKYLGRTCILLDKDGKSTSSNCTYWQRYTRTLFLHIPLSLSAEVHSMDLHIGQTSNYKPLAQSIPSYIKSSFDFVKKYNFNKLLCASPLQPFCSLVMQ